MNGEFCSPKSSYLLPHKLLKLYFHSVVEMIAFSFLFFVARFKVLGLGLVGFDHDGEVLGATTNELLNVYSILDKESQEYEASSEHMGDLLGGA
ncbi:hypothetical protein VNO78_23201 [Psophocarpus tetragonolobus]|uniref:Uncharacterized protein n=1 Tax=Psophocarpus tetragonolobus TaxID=3891 RepID=A0AAN9S420_PSOTE